MKVIHSWNSRCLYSAVSTASRHSPVIIHDGYGFVRARSIQATVMRALAGPLLLLAPLMAGTGQAKAQESVTRFVVEDCSGFSSDRGCRGPLGKIGEDPIPEAVALVTITAIFRFPDSWTGNFIFGPENIIGYLHLLVEVVHGHPEGQGDATSADDFRRASRDIVLSSGDFPANSANIFFDMDLLIRDDALDEDNENFHLRLQILPATTLVFMDGARARMLEEGVWLTDGVALTIGDNDTRGVSVSETALTVPEGGSAQYNLILDTEPTGNVVMIPSITGDPDLTVSPASLTFKPDNWAQAQTVTASDVSVTEDDDDMVPAVFAVS